MIVEIKVPSPGESITEVEIASWMVEDGEFVNVDQEIAEVESDKATLPLTAEASGVVAISIQAGETVAVGTVVCTIDTEKAGAVKSDEANVETSKEEVKEKAVVETKETEKQEVSAELQNVKVSPVAQKMMEEEGLSLEDVINGLKRISSKEVELVKSVPQSRPVPLKKEAEERKDSREKMSSLRKRLSQRLVAVKNETAMLTTFNEIDMSNVMSLRKKYQKHFVDKYGFKVGFMSFFTKAVTEALKLHPNVNSQMDGDEIVSFNYADIGIAVQTPKGLMVPIVRDADKMTLAEIEAKIKELAEKARNRKISVEELTGGTFTITNGGTFGSLLSTPIINPPQSGILGMHNIVERPVAVNGAVEIRPMMYVALSYDHRIIDGKDSVGFLVKVKEMIENPERMLFGGQTAAELLLGI